MWEAPLLPGHPPAGQQQPRLLTEASARPCGGSGAGPRVGRQRPSISGCTPVCLHVRCFQQDGPGPAAPPHTQPHLPVAAGWLCEISPGIFCPVPKCLSRLLRLFTEQRFPGLTLKRRFTEDPLEFSTVHSGQTVVILCHRHRCCHPGQRGRLWLRCPAGRKCSQAET